MTFPILIEVEDSALGAVLKMLHNYPGIAKLHLDLDAVSAPRGTRRGVPLGPRKQRQAGEPTSPDIIIAFLMTGPKRNSEVAEELERHGFARTSSASCLTGLKEKGIATNKDQMWDLTDDAKARMGTAVPALPAPPTPPSDKTAYDIVIAKMKSDGGTGRRLELAQALSENNLSAASISRVMSNLKKRGDIISGDEPGTYLLAPKKNGKSNGAAPPAEKKAKEPENTERGEKRTAILKLLKKRKRPMSVPDIATALGVKRGTIDGAMWRLQQTGQVEKISPGIFQISNKNAAEEPQTAAQE